MDFNERLNSITQRMLDEDEDINNKNLSYIRQMREYFEGLLGCSDTTAEPEKTHQPEN